MPMLKNKIISFYGIEYKTISKYETIDDNHG